MVNILFAKVNIRSWFKVGNLLFVTVNNTNWVKLRNIHVCKGYHQKLGQGGEHTVYKNNIRSWVKVGNILFTKVNIRSRVR